MYNLGLSEFNRVKVAKLRKFKLIHLLCSYLYAKKFNMYNYLNQHLCKCELATLLEDFLTYNGSYMITERNFNFITAKYM